MTVQRGIIRRRIKKILINTKERIVEIIEMMTILVTIAKRAQRRATIKKKEEEGSRRKRNEIG